MGVRSQDGGQVQGNGRGEGANCQNSSLGKGAGLAWRLGSGEDGEKALGLQVMEPQTFHGSQPKASSLSDHAIITQRSEGEPEPRPQKGAAS